MHQDTATYDGGPAGEAAGALVDRASRWFDAGEIDMAVQALERLSASRSLDLTALDLGIWVATAASRLDIVGELMARAVELAPDDAGRRLAFAHRLAGEGKLAAAAAQAEVGARLAPQSGECAFVHGMTLNELGRHTEAIGELLRAVKLTPSNPEIFHHLAYAAEKLGNAALAVTLAMRAHRLDPAKPSRALYVAHLLGRLDRRADAIGVLKSSVASGLDDAATHRTLSALLVESGDFETALVEIDAAIVASPDNWEYHVHRSSVLLQRGALDEAAKAAARAVTLDPANASARRHAVTAYLQGGDIPSALSTIADLLAGAPDNDEYISCMQHVLRLRAYEEIAPAFDILAAKRNAPPRPPRSPRGLADGLKTQGRVIGALILREVRTRFGDSRLGYLWALAEPAIHIGVLALVFPFTMHGHPPLGDNFFFFYFTGIVPYLLFAHTVQHLGHSLSDNRSLLQLPQVTHIDVLAARGILEFATILVVALAFVAGFLIVGVKAAPAQPAVAASALLTMWLLAMGVGTINAVINVFTNVWDHLFQVVVRILYFASGIFYVPAMMPLWVRQALSWNPLLHAIDWFRTAFFTNYEPQWLDQRYALAAGAALLLVGLALEFALRRNLQRM